MYFEMLRPRRGQTASTHGIEPRAFRGILRGQRDFERARHAATVMSLARDTRGGALR